MAQQWGNGQAQAWDGAYQDPAYGQQYDPSQAAPAAGYDAYGQPQQGHDPYTQQQQQHQQQPYQEQGQPAEQYAEADAGDSGDPASQFQATELYDGVRFAWNLWPSTKAEAARVVVPMSSLYTPLKQIENLVQVPYAPLQCSKCQAVCNPWCELEFHTKQWVCPFCKTRNHFSPMYADIGPHNVYPEMRQSTIEYTLPNDDGLPPAFLFVVDTCMGDVEDLAALKRAILEQIPALPANAFVGLMTYGRNVQIHELGFTECPKSYVFRGDPEKPVDSLRLARMLGLSGAASAAMGAAQQHAQQQQMQQQQQHGDLAPSVAPGPVQRLLVNPADAQAVLDTVFEDLALDPWPIQTGRRSASCGGTALSLAVTLLETLAQGQSGRIFMFAGSPPSLGLGNIVGLDKGETMRSHHDLFKGKAPHYEKSCKFFESVATRAVQNGHVVDVFACALDQVGIAELRVLVERTGGLLVLTDSFQTPLFQKSFASVFAESPAAADGSAVGLSMVFDAEMEVHTSREFKVSGCVGPCSSMNKQSRSVGDSEVGIGGTCRWALGGVMPGTTLGVFFQLGSHDPKDIKDGQEGYVQYITHYRRSTGVRYCRVTTLAITFRDTARDDGLQAVASGFDQEAAAVIMARLALHKAESEFALDILRWLDNTVIRLCTRFATFTPGNSRSFQLHPSFALYPQFMYHLRRSQFLQIFNSSPDETAFFRMLLLRESVENSLTMIQPVLWRYTLDDGGQPALLDMQARSSDCILVLDTFFHLVLWYGKNIASWRDQGLAEQPSYEYLRDFFAAPDEYIADVLSKRFPAPVEVITDEDGSQERFLLAKLNPSQSWSDEQTYGADTGPAPIFTDDVSYEVFFQHLQSLAVKPA